MAAWKDYLKVRETKGDNAAWEFARKKFARGSIDFESARRFHAPNAADKRETIARQNAINAVTRREIVTNCQMSGLPKFGR